MPWLFVPLGILATLVATVAWRQLRPAPAPSILWWYMDNPIARRVAGEALIRDLALRPGMHVLDAGCGPGRLTVPLARAVGPEGEVTALDLSTAMLKRVEASVSREGLSNVSTLHAALGDGAVTLNRYDRAVLVSVIGEIPRATRRAAMTELWRALRPGGFVAIAEMLDDPDYQRQASVRRLMTSCGFQIDRVDNVLFGYRLVASRPTGVQPASMDQAALTTAR